MKMVQGGRGCGVCRHDSRPAIDQAIVNGKQMKGIAEDFGFTYTRKSDGATVGDHKRISYHRDNCMAESYQAAVMDTRAAAGKAIASRIQYLDDQVNVAIKDALAGHVVMLGDTPMLDDRGAPMRVRNTGDLRILLLAVSQGRANAELITKLAGAVPDADEAQMDQVREALTNPEARRLLAELDAALAADDAAQAVVDAATEPLP